MNAPIRRRDFIAGTAAVIAAPSLVASPASALRLPAADELKDFLADQSRHFHIPGMSVAVACGSRAETISTGRASLPFDIPVDADTLFHIGSNGKRFTAAAILQLVESGRLSLADPIHTRVEGIPTEWHDRTLQHLLHHVSGIPDYLADFDWTKPHSRQDVLDSAFRQAPLFAANSGWSYSNTNYMLLGYAIESVTGMSYRQYVTERLLKPAQLSRTRIDDSGAIIPGRAEGYAFDGSALRHAATLDGDASGWPDGGIIMSAADSLRWEQAVQKGAIYGASSAATMGTLQRLSTGREVPYGCAEFIERMGSHAYCWHTGGVPGFTSFSLRVPARELSLLLATNVELDSSRPQRFLGQCVAEAFAPGSTPLGLLPARDSQPRLTAAARKVLFRAKAPLDPEDFAPEIAQLIRGPRAQSAAPVFAEPQDFALVEAREFPQAVFRRYRLSYPDRIEHVSIGYTPDDRIYWAWWL